jgi:hypothetical protein
VQNLCPNVPQGGGRILACLKQHQDQVSGACKQALLAAMGGQPGANAAGSDPAPAPKPPASPPGGRPAASSTASTVAASPRIAPVPFKETFAERILTDPAHENMRALTFRIPATWRSSGKLEWHYNWIENLVDISYQAENPQNAEAFFLYPELHLEQMDVAARLKQYNRTQLHPGDRYPSGAIFYPPLPPVQGLAAFIKMVRPNAANLKWVGTQELPDMAKTLSLPPWPADHGVAIKIAYDLDGKPVEEAFFGVYYYFQGTKAISSGSLRIEAGEMKQTNWGFRSLASFRAPAGTLEKRISVFGVIIKTMFVNPAWNRLSGALGAQIHKDFDARIKAGLDDVHAAQGTMERALQQEKAFQAEFDKSEAAYRATITSPVSSSHSAAKHNEEADSHLPDGGKRSAFDHFEDNLIGVDTVLDPENGNATMKLDNSGQYHSTDGLGNYFTTNDPNMTPEKAGFSGTWYPMTEAP